MSEPRRGRGRRDNGLDAALWTPLRDVDPRVGEHLLDLLREAGIAAYLEPSADVSPYTRTVYLPSPPSDRLFVDRARDAEARGLVDRNADEHARRRPPARQLRRDLDEEAEWRRIVAALEAEAGLGGAEQSAEQGGETSADPAADPAAEPAAEPAPAPSPTVAAPAEPDLLELPEEHYEPPPPPPLRPPAPASLYAVLLIAAGALLIIAPQVVRLSGDTALVLGVAGVAAGVAVLVSRMRERSTDDGDDGAVV